jgi:Trypsin
MKLKNWVSGYDNIKYKMKSTKLIKIFSVLIMLLSFSLVYPNASSEPNLEILDPKIKSFPPSSDCWLKGYSSGTPKEDWNKPASLLREAVRANIDEQLTKDFVNIFVNPYNNTIFVTLTNDSPFLRQKVLRIMDPVDDVNVIFRYSPASQQSLRRWFSVLNSNWDKIRLSGVELIQAEISVNGTINIGIKNLSIRDIETAISILDNNVPKGILVLYESDYPELDSSISDPHRPLVGGIKVQSNITGSGSLGYLVSWNQGSKYGILTAAHVVNTSNADMYQPVKTNAKYEIGNTAYFLNGSLCDAALVELDEGIWGDHTIWRSDNPIKVISKIDSDDFWMGQPVSKTGLTTETTSGSITGLNITVEHPNFGTLLGQTTSNYYSQPGDSGSPVYQMYGSSYCYALGIHWGRLDSDEVNRTYITSITNIETDLGFDLDLTVDGYPYFSDNFNDNEQREPIWKTHEIYGGDVDEASNKLKLSIPSDNGIAGTQQMVCGYWTQWKYPLNDASIEIDVTDFTDIDEMILFISDENIGYDPYYLTEWYRCLKTKYSTGDYDWYIQRKIDGDVTTINQNSIGGTFNMKIGVDKNYIVFYENDNLRYVEEYCLQDDMRFHIYTSTLEGRNYGTDYMDNFVYEPFSISSDYWNDNFNDETYNDGWDLQTGSASASGEKLRLSNNGNVVTEITPSTNRYVKADIKTVQNGTNHWEVGWLQAKYEDWDNQVYALVWPDGTVELGIRYNGNQNGWASSSGTVSNPIGSYHEWEFMISGDYAILKIDGEIIFNQYHDNFGDIQGKVGLRAGSPSIADYDNIVIIDE